MPVAPIRLRQGVVHQIIAGEMLLLDTVGGRYFDLNPSGSLMLAQLLAGASREQTLQAVQAEFDVDSERVAADLDALLTALVQAGLIESAPPA
jgi:hypothetical protein